MAIYYIAKTGSDSTGDGSSGNPWLTIQKGITTSVTGDTIEVAVGTYQEKLTTGDKALIFNASGDVILDGNSGTLTTPAITIGTMSTNKAVTFQPKPATSGTWTIQNFTGSYLVTSSSSAGIYATTNFTKVSFISNNNQYGVFSNTFGYPTFNLCTFTGFTVSGVYISVNNSTITLTTTNCTFTNCYCTSRADNHIFIFTGNTVTNATQGIYMGAGLGITASGNSYTNVKSFVYVGAIVTSTSWRSTATETNSTFTNVYDGKIYVDKGGSDSNAYPYTVGTAKLTVQAGINVAVTTDTIVVAAGTYSENLVTGDKSLTLNASGAVILDGLNTLAVPAINCNPTTTGRILTVQQAPSTSGSWTIQGYTGITAGLIYMMAFSINYTLNVSNATFISNSNNYAIYATSATPICIFNINNCTITGFLGVTIFNNSTNAGSTNTVTNTIFNNNVFYALSAYTSGSIVFTGNTVTNSKYAIFCGTTATPTAANNTYINCEIWWRNSLIYNFAQWKGLGYDTVGSTSDTLGLTLYVTKTGNDSNSGRTLALAKLTIQAAINAVITANTIGETIIVGDGTYNEKLVVGDRTLTLSASGAVILDGANTLAIPAIDYSALLTGSSFTINKRLETSGTWTIQNYTGGGSTGLIHSSTNTGTVLTINIANTTLTSNSNLYGLYVPGTNPTINVTANQSTFTGFQSIGICILMAAAGGTSSVNGCIFTNNVNGSVNFGHAGTAAFTGNTVTNSLYAVYYNVSPVVTATNNTYVNCYKWGRAAAGYTWAGWKALGNTYDNTASASDTIGLTLFVNKSGNDSNTGRNPANAKLTIQSALTLAVTGESIVVQEGRYNELMIIKAGTYTLYADGNVTIDGSGLGANYLVTFPANTNTAGTVSFLPISAGGNWIFRNSSGSSIVYVLQGSSSTGNYVFRNCFFYSNANATGVTIGSGGSFSAVTLVISGCLFSGFSTQAISSGGATSGSFSCTNSTVYNCGIGFNATSGVSLSNNIMMSCTTAWQFSTITGVIGYNQYYNITNWKAASTYTTLDLAKAAGYELGSVMEQPLFEDATNNVFYLKTASSLSRNQGAIPFGFATGSANSDATWIVTGTANNTGWYSPDGKVVKNVITGFFEQVSGDSAVLYSPVYDFGSVQLVKGVNLGADQLPPAMIDYSNLDTKPNYQTIRIRGSGNSFLQDAVSPSWNEIKTEQTISYISGRYIQIELVFRVDDIGA